MLYYVWGGILQAEGMARANQTLQVTDTPRTVRPVAGALGARAQRKKGVGFILNVVNSKWRIVRGD